MNQTLPKLIDTHAHLCDRRLDGNAIINSMKKDGLEKIITVGYDIKTSLFSVEIAGKNKDVYATAGVHPSEVRGMKEEDIATLLRLAENPKTTAIGEIGLDYHYNDTDREKQKYWLLRQLEVVEKTGLPAVLHLRDAFPDMQQIIEDNISRFRAGAVLHCFSGSLETAKYYLSKGFHLSFTGVITYQNAAKFVEIIRATPKNRLLIETDCPYLTPQTYRGKTNYPAYVRFVAEKVAEIWGVTIDEVADITRRNTYSFFTKMKND